MITGIYCYEHIMQHFNRGLHGLMWALSFVNHLKIRINQVVNVPVVELSKFIKNEVKCT